MGYTYRYQITKNGQRVGTVQAEYHGRADWTIDHPDFVDPGEPRTIERLDPKRFAWYATLGVGFLECGGSAAALTAARTELGSLILETRAEIDAWGPVGNSFPIMENLKLRFDPERRLNPGRFAGGL